ncbi:hypothetical protein WG906_12420 [Pedobacter sp. P351]|uniref:hypothetical protein n=1 Tax=Pedobacter superstes TaxID=3133441 RepID=UPI0030AC3A0B
MAKILYYNKFRHQLFEQSMTTVSKVLNNLKEKGYTVDFNLNDNCLVCHENTLQIHPEEFIVDKHYRFEGQTDPGLPFSDAKSTAIGLTELIVASDFE